MRKISTKIVRPVLAALSGQWVNKYHRYEDYFQGKLNTSMDFIELMSMLNSVTGKLSIRDAKKTDISISIIIFTD